jgi:hypothetical protein
MAAQSNSVSHDDFLKEFRFGGLLAVALDHPSEPLTKYYAQDEDITIPNDRNVFFGPAMRATKSSLKTAVLGSSALWIDADDPQKPLCTLPPSAIVSSGGGFHIYWFLDVPILDVEELEALNHLLIEDVPTADKGSWNANRVLRIPGTSNLKYTPPAPVQLTLFRPLMKYSKEHIKILAKLDSKTRHKIRTGDSRGYRSRSERDWAIVTKLIQAGASDELIDRIFTHQPCGDKAGENGHYLEQTLEKARATVKAEASGPEAPRLIQGADGYYLQSKRGTKRLSTFTIVPKVLLDGSQFESEDAIVCDVIASGYTWEGKVFSRTAFTSVHRFDTEAPVAAWQWLGRDDDIRTLLPHLLDQLRTAGLPKVGATSVLGLHKIRGEWVFLGNREVLTSTELFKGYDGPLCWLPSRKEHPELDLIPKVKPEEVKWLGEMIPQLNESETIWPMIGWYAATCLKPWFEQNHYRFPILNVVGTRGSGKTTLIQRVFLSLFGQTDPKTYDAGTTKFVTLALLGSSNAVPIAFSEFRYEFVEKLLRTVLLAYDTGHDPRGRGDQTTVDYPLSAPFSIDGEDLVADPAARERLVVAHLHPDAIAEGTECYTIFQTVRAEMPQGFAGYYLSEVLKMLPNLEELLKEARVKVFEAFPISLPDRVRNNHIVMYFGILLWCKITESEPPDAKILTRSISSVFNIEAGRASTLADVMVEDIVNVVAQGTTYFNTAYDSTGCVLWFQLSPAHSWWVSSRRRSGRGALERDAIKAQLKEAPYSVTPQVVSDAWMYGIDLAKAVEAGLDIPSKIPERIFVVRF